MCVCVREERCVERVMWLFMSLCFRLHSFASKFVALLFFYSFVFFFLFFFFLFLDYIGFVFFNK